MLRIAFRQSRAGILAVSAIGFFAGVVQASAFQQVAGTTAASHAAFGAQTSALARQIAYLLPLPVHPESLAGYIQWRVFGAVPLILMIWTIFSASGSGRGDEERGLVDSWIASGISRRRLLATRTLVFVLGASCYGLVTAAAAEAGAMSVHASLPVPSMLTEVVVLAALSAACFGIMLLVAQLVDSRRLAAGVGGAVLAGLFLLDGLARTAGLDGPYLWLSPFHYFNRSDPVAPGGSVDWPATAARAGLAVLAALRPAVGGRLFEGRDLGASALRRAAPSRPPTFRPSGNPLLRFPVLADLYDQRSGLAAWIVGTAVAALFITSIAKQTGQLVAQTPGMSGYLAVMGGEATITRGIVGQAGYSVVQTMLAIYALTAVSRWAADDQEGRLEMVLSRPVARWRVVVERAFALALGILLIIAGASLAVALVAPGQGVAVSAGDLFRAGLPLLPGAMLFGTLGAVFTARFPRIAVWAMGGYLVAAYLITQLGPLLGWPAWAIDLSVIRYYGDPLVSGIDWTGFWIMTAVAAAGFALALGAMQRREVGR